MESLFIVLGPILVGFFLYAIMHDSVRARGASLNKKFVSLGVLKGKL